MFSIGNQRRRISLWVGGKARDVLGPPVTHVLQTCEPNLHMFNLSREEFCEVNDPKFSFITLSIRDRL